MKMNKIILPTAVLLLLICSCEKESELVYEDYQSSTLLRQIGNSEEDMVIITYYNSAQVFEHLQRFSYEKYIYNSQNQLERIDIAMTLNPLSCAIIPGTSFEDGDDPRKASVGQYVEFSYSDDGIVESTYHYFINDETPRLMSYNEFVYDEGKVIRTNMFNPADELTQYFTYSYDEYGNVSEEEYYFLLDLENASLQRRIKYEYDDKINPFKVFSAKGTPGIFTNSNNITKQTAFEYYSVEEQSYTIENSYEYNDLGFPVKVNNVDYIYGKDE